jgi:hypothetical protein
MKIELPDMWEIITIRNADNMKFCVLILLWEAVSYYITLADRQTDRQTDGRTDTYLS